MSNIVKLQEKIDKFFDGPISKDVKIRVDYWFTIVDITNDIPSVEREWEECYTSIPEFSLIDNSKHRTCINSIKTY